MAALRLSTGADEHGRNKAAAAAVPPTAYCRVCFEGAEPGASPLVSPCQCTGSQAVIHRSCLRRWQRAALGSGNPARARVCGVCKAPYAPCFRIAKGQAARWGRKERLMLLQQQQRAEQQGSEAAAEGRGGEDDDVGLHGDGNASVMAGLRQAAGLLSPGGVLKSVTIFGLALVVPYLVLAYYAAFALSYIDPFDGAGRFGSSAAEAEQRRAAREAAAAAVAPGRTFLVASSSIAPGYVRASFCLKKVLDLTDERNHPTTPTNHPHAAPSSTAPSCSCWSTPPGGPAGSSSTSSSCAAPTAARASAPPAACCSATPTPSPPAPCSAGPSTRTASRSSTTTRRRRPRRPAV